MTLFYLCKAYLSPLLRKQPFSRSLKIYLTLSEALGVIRAALEAAITAAGLDHIREVDVVVIAHPYDLRLVAVEHFQLFVDMLGDVHVLGGVEAHAAQSVHIINGSQACFAGDLGLIMRQGGGEAAASAGGFSDRFGGDDRSAGTECGRSGGGYHLFP